MINVFTSDKADLLGANGMQESLAVNQKTQGRRWTYLSEDSASLALIRSGFRLELVHVIPELDNQFHPSQYRHPQKGLALVVPEV